MDLPNPTRGRPSAGVLAEDGYAGFCSFPTVGEQIVENTSSCRIKFISLLFYLFSYIKPRLSALDQPLRMATHALDWGDLLNRRQRRGLTEHHGDDICGGVVLMLDRFLVLFH
jgi:hypothetical protein